MADFDTSGSVADLSPSAPKVNGAPCPYTWESLTPFQQGYVEALFAEVPSRLVPNGDPETGESWDEEDPRGFSDLSPEALTRIVSDCERHLNNNTTRRAYATDLRGAYFWENRQGGLELPDFPPLVPVLSEDGKPNDGNPTPPPPPKAH
jgi:hypothetical protein